MTVPRILVVVAETWADDLLPIQVLLYHASNTLRDASGSTPILLTMGRTDFEQEIEWRWSLRGRLIEPRLPFKSKYQHVNSLVSSAPDLMLVFGNDKVTKRAVEGARRGAVEVVEIEED